jgi:hypothetical protein
MEEMAMSNPERERSSRSSIVSLAHDLTSAMDSDTGSRLIPPAVYYYRRELNVRETVTAAGIALGAGLAMFYLARVMLQRTPIAREEGIPQLDERGVIVRRARRTAAGTAARR